jgi:hypothetical protein
VIPTSSWSTCWLHRPQWDGIARIAIGQKGIGSVAAWPVFLWKDFNALRQVYGVVPKAFVEPANERNLGSY